MAELLRHRQTKEAVTDMFTLQPPRHIPTLPSTSFQAQAAHFRFSPDFGHIAASHPVGDQIG